MLTVAVSNTHMPILRTMLIAQNTYLLSKIKDKAFKAAYLRSIEPLLKEAHTCSDIDDFRMYFGCLKELGLAYKAPLHKRIFSSSDKEGVIAAYDLVNNVLISIDNRFINGGYRLYESLLRLENIKEVSRFA